MYIKLSFHEEVIIVPYVWGGLVVNLMNAPEIVEEISPSHPPNKRVNKKRNNDERETYDYDYYLDCGNANKTKVLQAIELFQRQYKLNKEYEGEFVFIADGDYPEKNFIINSLNKALRDTQYYAFAFLFLKREETQAKGKTPEMNAYNHDSNESSSSLFISKLVS